MSKHKIFISSVQKEFRAERRALKEYIDGDALLSGFFEVFLFEDLPASDRRADEVYLEKVKKSDIYLGLFGYQYGVEDREGVSPTQREFDLATGLGKYRIVFIAGMGDSRRHPKMRALISKAGERLVRKRFKGTAELVSSAYAALVEFLHHRGDIHHVPFDDRVCEGATLKDIDAGAVARFVRRARYERQFPLDQNTPVAQILTHLNLTRENHPTFAAVLLFGLDPQRFVPCAEIRCMHFHGTVVQRPVPFYRIFTGDLFEQVERAVDFVLSKINRGVGTRAESNQVPVVYEIPPDVITEAIVNAVAHRDYNSDAAVQVSVFADRVEVWNPGELPYPLTVERLREPHHSIARNHRVCEALFLTRYIEKYGTGTLMMIRESRAHALPEPVFEQREGVFISTIWRDWLTERVMAGLNLNDRQKSAVVFLKAHGHITNAQYQALGGGSRRTALRELAALAQRGIISLAGRGRGARYVLAVKRAINAPNAPSATGRSIQGKRAINAPKKPAPAAGNIHWKKARKAGRKP